MKILTYLDTDMLTVEATPCPEGKSIDPGTVEKMRYLVRKNRALGLAAPQVGIWARFFILNGPVQRVFVNPVIDMASSDIKLGYEGCLSFPWTDVEIPRSLIVRIKFQDEYGSSFTETFVGLDARTVQHEIDHLNGKGLWDYLK